MALHTHGIARRPSGGGNTAPTKKPPSQGGGGGRGTFPGRTPSFPPDRGIPIPPVGAGRPGLPAPTTTPGGGGSGGGGNVVSGRLRPPRTPPTPGGQPRINPRFAPRDRGRDPGLTRPPVGDPRLGPGSQFPRPGPQPLPPQAGGGPVIQGVPVRSDDPVRLPGPDPGGFDFAPPPAPAPVSPGDFPIRYPGDQLLDLRDRQRQGFDLQARTNDLSGIISEAVPTKFRPEAAGLVPPPAPLPAVSQGRGFEERGQVPDFEGSIVQGQGSEARPIEGNIGDFLSDERDRLALEQTELPPEPEAPPPAPTPEPAETPRRRRRGDGGPPVSKKGRRSTRADFAKRIAAAKNPRAKAKLRAERNKALGRTRE